MRLTAKIRKHSYAEPLPMPYPALEKAEVTIRRGQMSLTVAGSGVGKSQLWHNLAHRMGVPALYFSADTDQHVATVRAIAMWTQKTTAEVNQMRQDPTWIKWFEEQIARSKHVDFVFDTALNHKVVGERMKAFAELHGEWPHLVVVDNLRNTVTDPDRERAEQEAVLTAMQGLARESKAHIALLHHAKGEYESGTKPIPRSGSMNNMFRLPEVGLTAWRLHDGRLAVAAVKNRDGADDPSASNPVLFQVDLARATVGGFRA